MEGAITALVLGLQERQRNKLPIATAKDETRGSRQGKFGLEHSRFSVLYVLFLYFKAILWNLQVVFCISHMSIWHWAFAIVHKTCRSSGYFLAFCFSTLAEVDHGPSPESTRYPHDQVLSVQLLQPLQLPASPPCCRKAQPLWNKSWSQYSQSSPQIAAA